MLSYIFYFVFRPVAVLVTFLELVWILDKCSKMGARFVSYTFHFVLFYVKKILHGKQECLFFNSTTNKGQKQLALDEQNTPTPPPLPASPCHPLPCFRNYSHVTPVSRRTELNSWFNITLKLRPHVPRCYHTRSLFINRLTEKLHKH